MTEKEEATAHRIDQKRVQFNTEFLPLNHQGLPSGDSEMRIANALEYIAFQQLHIRHALEALLRKQ